MFTNTGGNNVFLVETVANDEQLAMIFWCALESAAKFNRDQKVFLITLHKSKVKKTHEAKGFDQTSSLPYLLD